MDKEYKITEEDIYEKEIQAEELEVALDKKEPIKELVNFSVGIKAAPKDKLLLFQNYRTEPVLDSVAIAAQQFRDLKASGVQIPDIFDKREQDNTYEQEDDVKQGIGLSNSWPSFDGSLFDEEDRSSPKNKHIKFES